MKLYYHKTDGGAEYYSTTFTTRPDGGKEGTVEGIILRTDGGEIELFKDKIQAQGLKLVITDGSKLGTPYDFCGPADEYINIMELPGEHEEFPF